VRGATLTIDFQNENLIARQQGSDGGERILAVVPDLICIVDSETAAPVTTEVLRYGLRVTVLGIPRRRCYAPRRRWRSSARARSGTTSSTCRWPVSSAGARSAPGYPCADRQGAALSQSTLAGG